MMSALCAQALGLHRRGIAGTGPITQAALLLDRYGSGAALMTDDAKVLTVLREVEREKSHVQR